MSYSATLLVTGQAKLMQKYASAGMREIDPVTYKALLKSTEIMMPSHKILRTQEDRPITASYFQRSKRALGSGRSSTPSGSVGVSNILTPSFATYSDVFEISMKTGKNNVLGYQETMDYNLENMLKNFSAGNETLATNFLFNNRSAVNAGVANGTFNSTTSVFEISDSTDFNKSLVITETNMAENLYGGMPLTIFCDSISFNKFALISQQGVNNALNTSFQFAGKTFVRSLNLTAKAIALGYTKGLWLAAADGMFGILDWIPQDNIKGADHGFAKWMTFKNPIDGLDMAAYVYGQPLDGTAIGGYTQDWIDNWEFSIDYAPELAPTIIGGAGETVVQAIALV